MSVFNPRGNRYGDAWERVPLSLLAFGHSVREALAPIATAYMVRIREPAVRISWLRRVVFIFAPHACGQLPRAPPPSPAPPHSTHTLACTQRPLSLASIVFIGATSFQRSRQAADVGSGACAVAGCGGSGRRE